MRNFTVPILVTLTLGFFGCKNPKTIEEIAKPASITAKPGSSDRFLKELTITSGQTVAYDSASKSFLVKLAENYTADVIRLDISLFTGVTLLDSSYSPVSAQSIPFSYKGSAPLNFTLQNNSKSKATYQVFVDAPGELKIDFTTSEISLTSNTIQLPMHIISGVGTTPSHPGKANPSVKFINSKNSVILEGAFYNNLTFPFSQVPEKLLSEENLTVEIDFGDLRKFTSNKVKFKRGLPVARLLTSANILSTKTDSITISGGYFAAGQTYEAEFSSDFTATPVKKAMKFLSISSLSGRLPTELAEGSYLVTFLENGKQMGKTSVYVSEQKLNALESIWTGSPDLALSRNTNRLVLHKGDTFFAKPSPVEYGSSSALPASFNENKLPALKLSASAKSLSLKPQITVVTWLTAGFKFAVGRYTVPADMLPGIYEATLVFPNSAESKPYWSKIEIK